MGLSFAATDRQQDRVDFNALLEFAEFSDAAYKTEPEIAEFVESRKYTLTDYRTEPELQVSFYIASNALDKTQIIAVRGTSNIENALVDISLKLSTNEYTGLRLHSGFSAAADRIYADLQPQLKKDYKINTTGHSLGGAVALILAMYLDKDNFNVGQVVTFGQPKVTNISGAKAVEHLDITRVVTPLDLVPLVPLFDPMDIKNLDIYWHCGREILLLDDTRYSTLEGLDSMLRATKFTQNFVTKRNLLNHQMSLYIELLKKKTGSSERVPYQNSFNLFNLFGK